MSECYRFVEEVSKHTGNFDECIDCMYVLLMEGTDREAQVREHIKEAGITSKVIYQYNKGYRECKKNLRVQATNYDLEHALKNAFRDALAKGYKRIIVLEDDCEFDERIKNPEIINDVCSFLIHQNPKIYTLGSIIPVVNPLDVLTHSRHHRLLLNFGSHCIIYNAEYMKWLTRNDCMLGHVDFETNRHISKYTYKIPLAYQKMVLTENVKEGWDILYKILNTLIFSPAGVTTRVQPGYDYIKKWFETFVVIIFFIMILCYVS
jgi:hypothetical protein